MISKKNNWSNKSISFSISLSTPAHTKYVMHYEWLHNSKHFDGSQPSGKMQSQIDPFQTLRPPILPPQICACFYSYQKCTFQNIIKLAFGHKPSHIAHRATLLRQKWE